MERSGLFSKPAAWVAKVYYSSHLQKAYRDLWRADLPNVAVTCQRIAVKDSAGLLRDWSYSSLDVPGEYTLRMLVGNKQGRSEWTSTAVIRLHVPPEEECHETPDQGHNTICDITSYAEITWQ